MEHVFNSDQVVIIYASSPILKVGGGGGWPRNPSKIDAPDCKHVVLATIAIERILDAYHIGEYREVNKKIKKFHNL